MKSLYVKEKKTAQKIGSAQVISHLVTDQTFGLNATAETYPLEDPLLAYSHLNRVVVQFAGIKTKSISLLSNS